MSQLEKDTILRTKYKTHTISVHIDWNDLMKKVGFCRAASLFLNIFVIFRPL